MEPADLEGCWTNRQRGKDIFQHETLWLFGPNTSVHALGELCTLSSYQGGDCGGSTHSFSGSWSLEGDLITMRMDRKTEEESGSAGHRNYETTGPCELTMTAKVVREGGETMIRLQWGAENLTLYRRAT